MKKTLRTMMLAAASVLGSVAVAHAQQPAPPAPPAPPGQPAPPAPPTPPAQPAPPPADFGVAPAALPAAPVGNAPVPTVSFGNQPAPDSSTPAPPPPKKKANPFLLTRLDWTNTASASIFGVGQDQQGSDSQSYTMDFLLRVRYAPIADSTHRLFLQGSLGWGAELTNSDVTAKRNQWQIRDLNLGFGYQRNVFKSESGVSITPLATMGFILPTSPQSQGQGRYLTTSLTGGAMVALPLVPKSDWFSDTFLIGIAGWSHLFARSYQPTNEIMAIQRPRMGPDGIAAGFDQLSGSSFAMDNLRLLFAAYTTVYKDLSLNFSLDFLMPFRHQFQETQITNVATGPVTIPASNVNNVATTTFDIGFSYTLFNMTRIDLGYQHAALQLKDDGKRRSLFYGPDAAFYTNVSVFLDSILDKAFNLTGGPTARRAAKAAAQKGEF